MNILIIDDEDKLRNLLSKIIGFEGFEVFQASNIKKGLKQLELEDVDVVICDVKLPDGNGIETVKIIKSKYPAIEIILLTAFGNIKDSVNAIKNGAFDYITKGNDNDRIIPLLYKAGEKAALNKRVLNLERQLGNKHSFDKIIGTSVAIKRAIEMAKKVAPAETTVLLTGETGTGKEVFAQAIHQASKRASYNFVAINCAAFSKELLENELFGHKTGAFTGANKDQKGLFEEAHNGTIFLDEIGEMAIDLQSKILRVLETGEFIRVGDTKSVKVNVRIIAATNRLLENEIEIGNFRDDLFYRLSVFSIQLPPLRERPTDIKLLSEYYVALFGIKSDKTNLRLTDEYLNFLMKNPWKGNIRELKNVIERSVILAEDNELTVETLPIDLRYRESNMANFSTFSMASVEKKQIQKVLNFTKGNKTEAARLLEIGVATLYRKIEQYKIS
ncbi:MULTISPECIES: sigma-54-dependent transcriptional regulator [Sphingobacterium]|uniref:sigma-54-dependent transcriptional regulator n=1 Tax=Sphingobacterium TaxID=28453 RepID=UPI00257F6F2D|nr:MULTISPECIES: sigma-54 dependent transcriptional regulator [Sphingobacterium]